LDVSVGVVVNHDVLFVLELRGLLPSSSLIVGVLVSSLVRHRSFSAVVALLVDGLTIMSFERKVVILSHHRTGSLQTPSDRVETLPVLGLRLGVVHLKELKESLHLFLHFVHLRLKLVELALHFDGRVLLRWG
jgi:hypothetical protein